MDHVTSFEVEARRDPRIAGFAPAELATGLEQPGACGPMDRAVDAAAALQRRVRGIDDRIDLERRDVGTDRMQLERHFEPLFFGSAARERRPQQGFPALYAEKRRGTRDRSCRGYEAAATLARSCAPAAGCVAPRWSSSHCSRK